MCLVNSQIDTKYTIIEIFEIIFHVDVSCSDIGSRLARREPHPAGTLQSSCKTNLFRARSLVIPRSADIGSEFDDVLFLFEIIESNCFLASFLIHCYINNTQRHCFTTFPFFEAVIVLS